MSNANVVLLSFNIFTNSVKVSTSNRDLVHVILGLSPEVSVISEFINTDISHTFWNRVSSHGHVDLLTDVIAIITSIPDITVAQVEACFDVVIRSESNILVDPHVTSIIGTDEESNTFRFEFTFSGTSDGIRVS